MDDVSIGFRDTVNRALFEESVKVKQVIRALRPSLLSQVELASTEADLEDARMQAESALAGAWEGYVRKGQESMTIEANRVVDSLERCYKRRLDVARVLSLIMTAITAPVAGLLIGSGGVIFYALVLGTIAWFFDSAWMNQRVGGLLYLMLSVLSVAGLFIRLDAWQRKFEVDFNRIRMAPNEPRGSLMCVAHVDEGASTSPRVNRPRESLALSGFRGALVTHSVGGLIRGLLSNLAVQTLDSFVHLAVPALTGALPRSAAPSDETPVEDVARRKIELLSNIEVLLAASEAAAGEITANPILGACAQKYIQLMRAEQLNAEDALRFWTFRDAHWRDVWAQLS